MLIQIAHSISLAHPPTTTQVMGLPANSTTCWPGNHTATDPPAPPLHYEIEIGMCPEGKPGALSDCSLSEVAIADTINNCTSFWDLFQSERVPVDEQVSGTFGSGRGGLHTELNRLHADVPGGLHHHRLHHRQQPSSAQCRSTANLTGTLSHSFEKRLSTDRNARG